MESVERMKKGPFLQGEQAAPIISWYKTAMKKLKTEDGNEIQKELNDSVEGIL